MKKIVFFCIPAHGHTNPTLGVVRELVSRGHQVWYYSYESMREKIEAAGAKFIACDAYDTEQKLSPKDAVRVGKDLAFSTKILVDTTLALDEQVCRDMEQLQPDCIVADSMAVWGKAVALKLGIPFVSSTTTFAFNQHSAKIMPRSAGDLVRLLVAMPKVNRHIRRLQNSGYPVKSILDIIQNDDHTHTIVYTSPEFQPYADTFSKEHYAFVGPSIRPAGSEIRKTGRKLIYSSMGTVNNDMGSFYRDCIRALGKTDHQVILSVGDLVDLKALGDLPDNVRVYPSVDQIAILQKADVFLTHCGMNSVSEALYFGVPLLMAPKTSEQKGVAARVAQLGAGRYLGMPTKEGILTGITQILENPSYAENAEKIGAGFRVCTGAAGAADKILGVCR